MADNAPVIVTVENVHNPDEDMKLLLATEQTVLDVKHYISNQASHLILSEQCLLYDGRILHDQEVLSDLLEGQTEVSDAMLDCCTC